LSKHEKKNLNVCVGFQRRYAPSYIDVINRIHQGEIGDLVVVFKSGAYGASSSPQAFLGHPAVVEVLVVQIA
jgi:predicted dehydrogenase